MQAAFTILLHVQCHFLVSMHITCFFVTLCSKTCKQKISGENRKKSNEELYTIGQKFSFRYVHSKADTQAVHTDFSPTAGRQRSPRFQPAATPPSQVLDR